VLVRAVLLGQSPAPIPSMPVGAARGGLPARTCGANAQPETRGSRGGGRKNASMTPVAEDHRHQLCRTVFCGALPCPRDRERLRARHDDGATSGIIIATSSAKRLRKIIARLALTIPHADYVGGRYGSPSGWPAPRLDTVFGGTDVLPGALACAGEAPERAALHRRPELPGTVDAAAHPRR